MTSYRNDLHRRTAVPVNSTKQSNIPDPPFNIRNLKKELVVTLLFVGRIYWQHAGAPNFGSMPKNVAWRESYLTFLEFRIFICFKPFFLLLKTFAFNILANLNRSLHSILKSGSVKFSLSQIPNEAEHLFETDCR